MKKNPKPLEIGGVTRIIFVTPAFVHFKVLVDGMEWPSKKCDFFRRIDGKLGVAVHGMSYEQAPLAHVVEVRR